MKINEAGKHVLDGVSFDIHAGEVVGIAGVEEMARATSRTFSPEWADSAPERWR